MGLKFSTLNILISLKTSALVVLRLLLQTSSLWSEWFSLGQTFETFSSDKNPKRTSKLFFDNILKRSFQIPVVTTCVNINNYENS